MDLGCSFCFLSELWGCRLNCLFPTGPVSFSGEVGGDSYSILGTTEPGAAASLMDLQLSDLYQAMRTPVYTWVPHLEKGISGFSENSPRMGEEHAHPNEGSLAPRGVWPWACLA